MIMIAGGGPSITSRTPLILIGCNFESWWPQTLLINAQMIKRGDSGAPKMQLISYVITGQDGKMLVLIKIKGLPPL
jgi:hypothetical protein